MSILLKEEIDQIGLSFQRKDKHEDSYKKLRKQKQKNHLN